MKAKASHANGTADRYTALLKALSGKRRKWVGGIRGHDVKAVVQNCRDARITVHRVAKKKKAAAPINVCNTMPVTPFARKTGNARRINSA